MATDHIYNQYKIKPTLLAAYLERNGWTLVHSIGRKALIFLNESRDSEIIVPLDNKTSDYAQLLSEALANISQTLKEPIGVITNKISFPYADYMRAKIISTKSKYGIIPLNNIVPYFDSLRKWLLAGAAFSINPRRYHTKISTKDTEKWINRCRIGQTEPGSYCVNIIFPLEDIRDHGQCVLIPQKAPLTRRITNTLMQSASEVIRAIEDDDISDIKQCHEKCIISANLCKSIVEMQNNIENGDISLSTEWHPSVSNITDNIPNNVVFHSMHKSAFEEISKELTPETPEERQKFSGFVTRLHREEEDSPGEVTILYASGKKRKQLIATLNTEQYTQAIDAHKNNLPVFVSGLLTRHGKLLRINDPTDFAVADVDKY